MGCPPSKPKVTDPPIVSESEVQPVLRKPEVNPGGDIDPRAMAKVVRYRAKFDQRVTAKYDIQALIGRGSYSRVVRAQHRITKKPYAIKMVNQIHAKDMCEAELRVLQSVQHKYVIRLHEVFESSTQLYMVVDLATGGELFDRVVLKGSFVETEAVFVLRMVLEGLQYLHERGIAHRDLKPENLLYYHPGEKSKILITDFGLSAFRKTGSEFMKTICGTPEYIAPEVISRHPYTCLVDMWAVGVVSFILLSATMPFDDDNRSRLYKTILRAKYGYDDEHWKYVSASAKDFIDHLLVVDPHERLTAVQALGHTWLNSPPTPASTSKELERSSLRNSEKSARSSKSNKSNRSGKSLRSDRGRVTPEEIEELHRDPEVRAELSSLAGSTEHAAA